MCFVSGLFIFYPDLSNPICDTKVAAKLTAQALASGCVQVIAQQKLVEPPKKASDLKPAEQYKRPAGELDNKEPKRLRGARIVVSSNSDLVDKQGKAPPTKFCAFDVHR